MFDFLRGIFPATDAGTTTAGQLNAFGSPAGGVPMVTNPASIPGPTLASQPPVVPGGQVGQTPQVPQTPQTPQNWFGKIGGVEGLGSIASGLASLGQLYGALQGIGIARKQLKLSERAFETNLGNQTQSYNTSLEDRIRSRYATEGRGASEADAYLREHSL